MTDRSVVYIAGYGRSGSTLLARLLGNHRAVTAVGELVNLPRHIAETELRCSCGRRANTCDFWRELLPKYRRRANDLPDVGQTRIKVEGFPRGLLYLFLHKVSGTAKSYGAFWRCVFDQLFVRLPSETRFVVDSSKTTWSRLFRPFALRTIAGLDVKMVHLVRDGRGCIWSNLRGEDNGLLDNQNLLQRLRFPAARTAFHWALANLAAHGFRLAYGSDRYCRVNYEELVGDPTATCRRVERFLGVQDGRGWIIGDKVTFALDHLIAGNRMRSHRSTDIRLDDEWREHLTPGKQALFWLINWPLALWYGYRI